MKQALNLKQKQVPRLSMQTWIPLLQCSLENLDKHLQAIANENPCIEVKTGFEGHAGEHADQGANAGYTVKRDFVSNTSGEMIENVTVGGESLYEKLDRQIAAPLFPTPISQEIARQIIFYINNEGYFEGGVEEIAEQCNTTPEQVEKVRQRFAYLEPLGVGAMDHKESFLFQLSEYDMDEEMSILLSALILQFDKIEKFLRHPRIKEAKQILSHLNNPPAIAYMEEEPPVIPEVFVVYAKGEFDVKINSRFYPDVQVREVDKDDTFAKQKFKEARELVKLMDLRKATLYNVTLALLERQYTFFMGGELKPLRLQDIADMLGFNESTISRAIDNKYLQTERGIFAFKDFFSNAIGEVSTSEIKQFIARLVKNEDLEKPFSDKYLHEMTEERFKISMTRRAIAKYRQELKIPSYTERKFLYKLQLL